MILNDRSFSAPLGKKQLSLEFRINFFQDRGRIEISGGIQDLSYTSLPNLIMR